MRAPLATGGAHFRPFVARRFSLPAPFPSPVASRLRRCHRPLCVCARVTGAESFCLPLLEPPHNVHDDFSPPPSVSRCILLAKVGEMSTVYDCVADEEALRRPSIVFSSCDSLDGTGRADGYDADDDGGHDGLDVLDDAVSPLRRASSFSLPPTYFVQLTDDHAADATTKGGDSFDADHASRSSKSSKSSSSKGSSSSWTSHLPVAFGAHQVIVPNATATRPTRIPNRSQSAVNEASK